MKITPEQFLLHRRMLRLWGYDPRNTSIHNSLWSPAYIDWLRRQK